MKWIERLRQYWQILLLTVAMAALAVCVTVFDDAQPQTMTFDITGTGSSRQIVPWQDGNGITNVFLPSWCETDDVTVDLHTSSQVLIDGKPVAEGQRISCYETGKIYPLRIGRTSGSIRFLKSENVHTLFIDTASGTMKAVHADKSNRESCDVTLIAPDGAQQRYTDVCSIAGRGNSTWVYEKKPYVLTFTQETELLNLGAAFKWVLLANAVDESNLRNKMISDLAKGTGFDWSPECEYVDLYLNGEYRGLYLLSERVEIGESRLDIGADGESFLCKLDLNERLNTLKDPFVTELGRAVEITDPKDLTDAQIDGIAQKVQRLEDTILSCGDIAAVLDIDSWARKFLVDEISENLDGDRASSYFYYTDGKFYAGPLWDYDHIMGTRDRNLYPEALLATSCYKSDTKYIPYYYNLYRNPVFYERVVQLYETEFLPLLQELAETGLVRMGEGIAAATAMNSIRWQHMFDLWQRPDMDAQELAAYLNRRIAFLNSVWLEGEQYYMVQVEIGVDLNYLNYAVKPGACFTMLSEVTVPGVAEPSWVDAETGEPFDESQPITRNVRLHLEQDTALTDPKKDFAMVIIYGGVIAAGIALFIFLDRRRDKPKGGRRI